MPQGRTLGDVPGIDGLLPNAAVLSPGYSVTEVNALGAVTADATGLGGISAMGTGDPFAYSVGFADREREQEQAEASAGPSVQYDPMGSSYLPTYTSNETNTYIEPSVDGFDEEQIANARTIAEVGKSLGATDRDIQVAIMAAIVESNIRSLDYGDRDSIGIFQQRDAWGSREDRLDPAKSAEMFFLGGAAGQEGLLDIKDRDKRSLGDLAQDVQVSAYPDRYAEHEAEAMALLGAIDPHQHRGKHGNDPYGLTERDGETLDNLTAAALDAALKEFGGDMRIMQGSHSHDVAASGGTHDGGGVLDLDVPSGDWAGAMTALRKIGFAAWVRNVPGYGSAGSGAHIHAVLIGNERLSPQAQTQVQSYFNNDDGLSGSRPDDGPRAFINNRFVWGETKKQQGPTWRDQIVRQSKNWLGTPFKWGGEDFSGVDTMGFLRSVYKNVGLDLPKYGEDLAYSVDPIEVTAARPGDLIAWDRGQSLGIYLGQGQFIEAGAPGRVVQLNELGTDVLDAWGIPIQQLLDQPRSPARPAPVQSSGTYSSYVPPPVSSSGAPLQGQSNAPVERSGGSPKPNKNGPHQNTTWDQKPHPI